MFLQSIRRVVLGLALALAGVAEEREALLVVHQEGGSLTFLDPATGEARGTVPVGLGPHGVAVSPDGRRAVVANYGSEQAGNSLSVVDTEHVRLVRNIPLVLDEHQPGAGRVTRTFHRPSGVTFTDDLRQVLVTCEVEGTVLLVDIEKAEVLAAIDTGQELSSRVILDHTGRRAFVSNRRSGSISAIDLLRRRLLRVIETGGGAGGLALHPTRGELWVANYETNSISVVDTETLEEVTEFPCGAYPVRLAFTPDGRRVLCVNYQGGSVSVFDAEERRLVREVRLEKLSQEEAEARPLPPEKRAFGRSALPVGLHLSADGATAWVALSRGDRLAELDVPALAVRRYFATGGRGPEALAWSVFEDDVTAAK